MIKTFYRIVPCDETEASLMVSNNFWEKHLDKNAKSINVRAGQRKQNAKVKASSGLDANTLKISRNVLEHLSIPLDLSYQISIQDDCMNIGPVIGLLASSKDSGLTESKLKRLLSHASCYEKFNGLTCVFSWEGIDFNNKAIKGYYFKKDEGSKCGFWKKGTMPIPDVVYNRTLLPNLKIQKLKRIVNNKLFNSLRLDKLSFWNMAGKSKLVSGSIPVTKLLSSMEDLDEMLEKHERVYLKPVSGSLAKGLIRVHKSEGNYCFQINDNPYPVAIRSGEAAFNYFNRIKQGQQYVVQQAVNSIKFENRYVDFRVIMQKDETLKWQCVKIVAKIGKENGICSNFKDGGYALTFEEAFVKVLGMADEEIHDMKMKLIDACNNACRMLDETGENFADIGIDAAIDDELNIWILEVNTRHDHKMVLSLKDKKSFQEVRSNPIKHAVALSGFNIQEHM